MKTEEWRECEQSQIVKQTAKCPSIINFGWGLFTNSLILIKAVLNQMMPNKLINL
jgi:hypothetical protein